MYILADVFETFVSCVSTLWIRPSSLHMSFLLLGQLSWPRRLREGMMPCQSTQVEANDRYMDSNYDESRALFVSYLDPTN